MVRGGARGAAVGAVGGAIGGDAGKGAAAVLACRLLGANLGLGADAAAWCGAAAFLGHVREQLSPDAVRARLGQPLAERVWTLAEANAPLLTAMTDLASLAHAARVSLVSRILAPGRGVPGLDERQLDELRAFLGCGMGC